ncbi:MAG: FecR domain-containing protein [Bacteroidales bacterium]|nr:FecR domain-containing protein [Bacteroidales bacterium]MDD3989216.1 FecR domain-containing protein [Bacteroidales bacterium]MDD4639234.1 FecR domain-containing protein [Bacteroidales bacterium]
MLDSIESLNEKETEELLSDKDFRESLKAIDDFRRVIIEDSYSESPDANKEWQKFHSDNIATSAKKNRINRNRIYAAVAGIAAVSVLFLFILNIIDTKTTVSPESNISIYTATETPRQVVIITENGEIHSLKDSVIKNSLNVDEKHKELSYKDAKVNNQVAVLHTLVTPQGEDFKLVLDDGTEIWVNSNSKLTYPVKFIGNERVINIEGEAYCKVAHDPKRKFIITGNDVRAEVLGTEFNIRNYTVYDTQITLVKGSVEVSTLDRTEKTVLTPGLNAHLSENGLWDVKEVDTDIYTMWHNGYLYFDNETIATVMKKIGEWYNVNVEFTDASALDYHIRFLANRKEPLENTLKLLNGLEKVKVTKRDNTIVVRASLRKDSQF